MSSAGRSLIGTLREERPPMTNKIPKELMREFKQVVGITGAGSAYWQPELAQVIDLAAEWCEKYNQPMSLHYVRESCVWIVDIGINKTQIIRHQNLPRAIMTAVVAASREVKA